MTELAQKSCVPCKGGISALKGSELAELGAQLEDWQIVDEHHLLKTFTFVDFKTAHTFLNEIAEVAEAEGHHPDLVLAWGRVEVKIWTHKIDGLAESDFVLAAKIDILPR